jgi:carotenoid cleavage dioxygenase-like enzyme
MVDDMMHGLGVFGDAVGAHPKVIRDKDGNEFLVLYSISFKDKISIITFFELDECFRIDRTVSYEVSNSLYFVHDIQVSEDFYFFVEHSVDFNWRKLQSHGLVNCVEMVSSKPYNILHAVPRKNTKMIVSGFQKEVLPGMVTHYAGLPQRLGACYTIRNVLYPSKMIEWDNLLEQGGRLYETLWNLETNNIEQKVIVDHLLEFPVMSAANTLFATVILDKQHGLMSLKGPRRDYWFVSDREFLSEPVVADDWVLVIKYSAERHSSVLLIFEVNDISIGPICEIDTPCAMPIGLHGWWSPKKS